MRRVLFSLTTALSLIACHDTVSRVSVPELVASEDPSITPVPARESDASLAPAFVPERVTFEGMTMGTHLALAAFTTPSVDKAAATAAFERARKEFDRLEALMTTWRPDSDVSRVNAAAGERAPIDVDPETYEVVRAALDIGAASSGAFDITFESLHGVWKFDEDLDPHPPSKAALAKLLPLVDYRRVHLEPPRGVRIDKRGVKIGLGGIAKGYAVDAAARVLGDAGLESFFVQAGGDLYTRGHKPDGTPWSAGIRDPRGDATTYFALLEVSDHAFSTAGDYERSYVVDGKRYHHIIDPKTGYPATACRSVTVWAKSAFLADQIDDAVFILGPARGLKLVEKFEDAGAVVIDAKNNLWISENLKPKLRITRVPSDGT